LARKKGRKKVAINSFQKKSIISIMKKRSKITAVVREEKENEKRYHKKHKLIIKRKKV